VLNEIRNRWFEDDFAFEDFYDRRTATEITDDVLRWIGKDRDRPFFAFANYFDVHDPYIAPDSLVASITRAPHPTTPPVQALKHGQLEPAGPARIEGAGAALDRYEAALTYLDGEIGRLLAQLDASGKLDNTIVIITSDHGEEFGEHGLYWHAHSLYLPALHVPLVVVWPGNVPAGRRVAEEATIRDVAATVLDLASIGDSSDVRAAPGPASPLPGESLSRYWTDGAPRAASTVISTLTLDLDGTERWPDSRRLESILLNGHHYIRNEKGPDELYDIRLDPFEQRNLATAGVALKAYRDLLAAARSPLSGGAAAAGVATRH
jgi:arylsulfatase A-like enzyme